MKIKNFDELAVSDSRRVALEIAEAGLQAIDTENVIRNTVRVDGSAIVIGDQRFELGGSGKVVIGGIGKCALEAAHALEDILGDRISGGTVLYIAGEPRLKKLEAIQGTHPLPSDQNVRGATAIVGTLKGLTETDLLIFVVSGGGSTLLCLPEDMGCREEASIMQALMQAGATIQEVNTVRKHLSLARGGYLAKYAYPARVVSLIFSDVPGNDIQFIASGPTVKDTTTIEEAEMILAKYNILNTCGMEKCGLVETPKDEKYFKNVSNILVVYNRVALDAMAKCAEEFGYAPRIVTENLNGEARDIGKKMVEELSGAAKKDVLLYGGETTVTVKGRGRGGRNQELIVSALRFVKPGELLLAIGSDGRDNGELAGAICDTITKDAADGKNVDIKAHLDENNETPFFEEIGNYIMTGNTGSNVSDLIIALKE